MTDVAYASYYRCSGGDKQAEGARGLNSMQRPDGNLVLELEEMKAIIEDGTRKSDSTPATRHPFPTHRRKCWSCLYKSRGLKGSLQLRRCSVMWLATRTGCLAIVCTLTFTQRCATRALQTSRACDIDRGTALWRLYLLDTCDFACQLGVLAPLWMILG